MHLTWEPDVASRFEVQPKRRFETELNIHCQGSVRRTSFIIQTRLHHRLRGRPRKSVDEPKSFAVDTQSQPRPFKKSICSAHSG